MRLEVFLGRHHPRLTRRRALLGLIETQGVRNPAVPYTIGNVQRGRELMTQAPRFLTEVTRRI